MGYIWNWKRCPVWSGDLQYCWNTLVYHSPRGSQMWVRLTVSNLIAVAEVALASTILCIWLYIQNKMDRTWRSCEPGPSGAVANKDASHLGQLVLYVLGAQAKWLQVVRRQPKLRVTPLLGLFIENLQVCLNPWCACEGYSTYLVWPSVCPLFYVTTCNKQLK